jgi:hypothetical protein
MMATMKLALDWIFGLVRMSSAVSSTIRVPTTSANGIPTGKLSGAELGC